MKYVLIFWKQKYSLCSSYLQSPKDIHLLKEISIFKYMGTDELIIENDEITTNLKVDDTTLPSST